MSANKETSRAETQPELLRQGLTFLHQARDVRGLHTAQVERIGRRLKASSPRPRRVVLVPALAALGLVLVAGAAFAVATGGLRSLPIVGPLLAPAASTDQTKSERHRAVPKPAIERPADLSPVPSALAPAPIQPAPTAAAEPARALAPEPGKISGLEAHVVHTAGPRPRSLALRAPEASHQSSRGIVAPESPAPLSADREENPIVAESRSFASVIGPWHRTHNASATLALLDAHEQRFPGGHMRLESRVLRAEIYLSQGRESEALSVLDSVAVAGIPRGRELQAVRGELRIKAGRCAEGKRDLSDVLEKGVADALAKRATQAISRCP